MIRITREEAFSFISYKIFIDGIERGKIKNNQTIEFTTGKGWHTVRAEQGGGSSKDLRVNVKNSIINLEVGDNVKGWEVFHAIEYITTRKDEALFLRKKKAASSDITGSEAEDDIEELEEEQLDNAASSESSQEAEGVRRALEGMKRLAGNIALATVALAGINVFLGAALAFWPELLDRLLFLTVSSVPLVFGLLYLVLSIGLYQRSRVFAIATVIVHFTDWVLLFMSGLGSVSTISMAIRLFFLVILFGGLTVSFRYHTLKKKYEVTTNHEIATLIQESKPRVGKAQVIACTIIGLVGIGTLTYALTYWM